MTVTIPSGKTNPDLDQRLDTCREAIADSRQLLNTLDKLLGQYQDKHFLSTRAFNDARLHVGSAWRALGYADTHLEEAHS